VKQERPLRLFADAHVFDGAYQGTRSFLLGLYTALAKDPGIEIYLGANDTDGLRRSFGTVAARIRFIRYKSNSRMRRLLWEIPRILRTNGIDYAHFQYVSPLLKVCPYIVTTHDILFEEQGASFPLRYRLVRSPLFRRSAHRADILTTVSNYAAASICRHYKLAPAALSVIPNAVNSAEYSPELPNAARSRIRNRYGFDRYLLNVSRLEPRKNQELLVAAFSQLGLAARGYHLVLIGARSLPVPALDAALAKLSAEEKEAVLLLENVTPTELQHWYQGAALFLYPSQGEGFGIPPLEAAAARVPVLCSNTTAMADFDFFAEDHIDPSDRDRFIQRIALLLREPPTAGELEKRANTVMQRYSWESSARLLLELVRQHRAQNNCA
jgi:glycosyltransferase involved in cell wall biosynthesis